MEFSYSHEDQLIPAHSRSWDDCTSGLLLALLSCGAGGMAAVAGARPYESDSESSQIEND